MVNAARTYLINAGASGRYSLGTYGEEYIPQTYKPIVDEESLKTVRSVLFGTKPDNFTQNYRAGQYMAILHASDIGLENILALDKRYTYSPFNSFFNVDLSPLILAQDTNAQGGSLLFNEFSGRDLDGQNAAKYKIVAVDATTVSIQEMWFTFKTTVFTTTSTANSRGGRTYSPIQLPGINTKITISTANAATGNWIIDLFSRPSRSVDEITQRLRDIQGAVASLCFGGKSEPYTTFYNMFLRHPRTSEQLAGVLLALIYRTKEIADAQ
jgi:hypothetical protein